MRKSGDASSSSSIVRSFGTDWHGGYVMATAAKSENPIGKESWDISITDIARISPLAHQHINFLGRHTLGLPETVVTGKLRPLR